jgi:predicted anti-sigma-YlaC factor YlaD
MLTCRDIADLASDHLEGQLSLAQRIPVRIHLAMCRHCRRYLEQVGHTIRFLRQLPGVPASADAREALLDRFREWRQQVRGAAPPAGTDRDRV